MLFNPRSTYSFVSQCFAGLLDRKVKPLDFDQSVSTPLGSRVVTNFVVKDYSLFIGDREFLIDLILLEMHGLDVILSMDWLAAYHATLDCFEKRVVFRLPEQPRFIFYGDQAISSVQRLFSLSMEVVADEGLKLESILVVNEFPEVFPKNL